MMPAIAKNKGRGRRAAGLVNRLAIFLEQGARPSAGQPVVVENRIAQTKSVHVVVIWDAWETLTPAERSKVILGAFPRAGRLRGATITVAMGLTAEEALRMGFLPYSIVTTRRPGDKTSQEDLSKAMVGAGGIFIKVGAATQLRFPTLEAAEDAYRRLSQKVPGPYWAIVHQQPGPD